jgi:transcriptional antiterminator Rof (Rho-off)
MSDKANTPDLITTLCFYDGDDKYAEASKHIKRLSKELRSVMNEGFSIDDRTIQVVVLYGGDAKWISGVNGQSGQAHTCPCPWCETERKDFWRGNDHPHVFRTFGKCKEHSHTKDLPFHCSICKETFRSDKDLKDNKKGWKDLREFSLKHMSQKIHLAPLLPCDAKAPLDSIHIACLLHLILRLVANAYTWTVRIHLKTEANVNAVERTMKVLGIHMPKQSKLKKKDQIKDTMGKPPSLHGRDCEKLLIQSKYADVLCVLEGRSAHVHQESLDLWRALRKLVIALKEKFDAPEDLFKADSGTMNKREAQAEKIRHSAACYRRMWLAVSGGQNASVPFYIHVAEVHVPRMTMSVGWIGRFQMQGEEHLHSQRKKDRKTRTNHRLVGSVLQTKKDGTKAIVKKGKHYSQLKLEAIRRYTAAKFDGQVKKSKLLRAGKYLF